ncbi:restriction endonuclease subunit S [Streptomyces sp. AK04-3B]|uniref:restriction endonuclease subunit S n=1 Tax=Streptomyces sp. AK04-3B TaxID=3028650 RepID=UPI0039F4D42C
MKNGTIDFAGSLKTSPDTYAYMVRTGCRPKRGDVLFSKDGSIGTTALVVDDHNFVVASSLIIVSPDQRRMTSRFLNFVFSSRPVAEQARTFTRGAGLPRISVANLARIELPCPPLDEQRAIADYLDHETAQVDALVAKQEELIGLLRERQKAGVRIATGWGHSLPDTWTSVRLSHLFSATGSGTTPANEDILDAAAGDVAWVTTSELRERQIYSTQRAVSLSTVKKYSALKVYPAGTLLIAMYGATIGRTGLLGVPAATNQACCALVGPVGTSVEFVEYSLQAAREWLLLEASGGGQPNINQDKVRAFRIPVPPLDEQRAIVAHISEQTSRIDALIAKAEEHIALAKERRSALITAAVTGKIDVRTARMVG